MPQLATSPCGRGAGFAHRGHLIQQNLAADGDAAANKLLVKEGYDPQFGARPLKRTIQSEVLDPLANKLLLGEFKPRDHVRVKAQDGELVFEK